MNEQPEVTTPSKSADEEAAGGGWIRRFSLSLTSLAVVFGLGAGAAVAVPSDAVRFVYDDDGRLKSVVDPASDAATFSWDKVGNLLSIDRFDSTDLTVSQANPSGAAIGATVQIHGTGFRAVPGQSTVTFDGTAATVTAASTTLLVVTVPVGATSGPLVVTTPDGTATADQDFEVLEPTGPSITDVQPRVTNPGGTLTVSGERFASPSQTAAVLNNTRSDVATGSSTVMTIPAPTNTSGGRLFLSTAIGETTGPDVFIPPSGVDASSIQVTDRMTIGSTKSVPITTAGKAGLIHFDGEAGQRVSLNTTGFANYALIRIIDPYRSEIAYHGYTTSAQFVGPVTLPSDGTYTVLFDPNGSNTGTAVLDLRDVPNDIERHVEPVPTGDSEALTFSHPGQNAALTLDGNAGQAVSVTGSGLSAGFRAKVSIVNAAGAQLGSPQDICGSGCNNFLDRTVLPADGEYRVIIDPTGFTTGSLMVTTYDAADDVEEIDLTTEGETYAFSGTTPGANARLTFDGEAGQVVTVRGTGLTSGFWLDASVRKVDGTVVGSIPLCTTICGQNFLDQQTLPASGSYQVYVDPRVAALGVATIKVYEAPDVTETITPTPGGTSRTVELGAPGQNAELSFAGTAGQRIAMSSSGFGASAVLSLRGPSGELTNISSSGSMWREPTTLPANGTYVVRFNPANVGTGTVTLVIYDVPTNQSHPVEPTSNGAEQALEFDAPGQAAVLPFEGQEGQPITVTGSSLTNGIRPNVSVVKADGTPVGATVNMCPSGCDNFVDQRVLPADGDYKVIVDPRDGDTGDLTVRVFDATNHVENITPTATGIAKTVALATPGQNLELRFNGTAGQRIARASTAWAGSVSSFAVIGPDGQTVGGSVSSSAAIWRDPIVLPTTGAYKIWFDPSKASTGTATVTTYDVPTDQTVAITPDSSGDDQALTFNAPGQNAKLTFSGDANDLITILGSAFTGGIRADVTVVRADGVSIGGTQRMCASGCSAPFIGRTLPTTGDYWVLVSPYEADTGGATIETFDASDVNYSTEIDGDPLDIEIASPGQTAKVAFSGTAGTPIRLVLSDVTVAGSVSIRRPNGSSLVSTSVPTTGKTIDTTLPDNGTYSIWLTAASTGVGEMTLALTEREAPIGFAPSPPTTVFASFTQPTRHEASHAHSQITTPSRRPTDNNRTFPKKYLAETKRSAKKTKSTAKRPESKPTSETAKPGRQVKRTKAARVARPSAVGMGPEVWVPTARHRRGVWSTDRHESPWQDLPSLQPPSGVPAVAGQVLRLNGLPLRGVSISVDGQAADTVTDYAGRFVLPNVAPGHRVLVVNDGGGNHHRSRYGTFEIGVDIKARKTTLLEQPVWMSRLDPSGDRTVAVPTRKETVLTTPSIPGLEVHIPAGSRIRDRQGNDVRKLNMTAIPIDRAPFPLPQFTGVPTYFTLQPGGAYLSKGAQIIYPNYNHLAPGQRVDFWSYDPDDRGWHVYGRGTVTPNGKQVVPDKDVKIWEFTGAMFSSGIGGGGLQPPPHSPNGGGLGGADGAAGGGDPVDLATGMFIMDKTDLMVSDTLPATVTRTYRPDDSNSYAFGKGAPSQYDLRLRDVGSSVLQEVNLVLPSGRQIEYERVTPGSTYTDAAFETDTGPGLFHKSRIEWDFNNGDDGWHLRLTNGTVFFFPAYEPLRTITDRHGNTLKLTRSNGSVTRVTTTSGRWIAFTYDGSSRVIEAEDNAGRSVTYDYDGQGRLEEVTDPEGGTTTYSYDSDGRMHTIEDARGITYLTNEYDSDGRVVSQVFGDGATNEFDYEVDSNDRVTETTVTDEREFVREVTFNGEGYPLTDTYGASTADSETFTYERESGTGRVLSVTDEADRKTEYEYDGSGRLIAVTTLADTGDETTSEIDYAPGSNGPIEAVTDQLGHTVAFEHDAQHRLTASITEDGRRTTYSYQGGSSRVATITDPLGNRTKFSYAASDLSAIRGPDGSTSRLHTDAAGRITGTTDPAGRRTRFQYDDLNELIGVTQPGGGYTQIERDPNGNIELVTDARGNTVSGEYDDMDRLISRTDGLNRTETFDYDEAGNTVRYTDRRGTETVFDYDVRNQPTFAGFGATGDPEEYDSTIEFDYDEVGRPIELDDSLSGEYSYDWDGRNRVEAESGPQGEVTYSYDDASRRTGMTVTDQDSTTYSYDDDDRLTGITQGAQEIGFEYDDGGRPARLTLPNGISQEYTYNTASRLTGIVYKDGTTPVGEVNYDYDASGRRTAVWGDQGAVSIPPSMDEATYDDANQRISEGTTELDYDANGNLVDDGTATYEWNSRNTLASVTRSGGAMGFTYDPFGRRQTKTVGGTTTSYLYDMTNVVQEQTGGDPVADMVTGLETDQRFSRTTSAGTQSYLTDGQGSAVGLVGSLGWPADTTYTYDPFGRTTVSGASSDNPYQYTGRENDGNGLYHYRARYYSADQQRFISPDPIGMAGGDANYYAYVRNDPTNLVDPTGLFSIKKYIGKEGSISQYAAGMFDGVTVGFASKVFGADCWGNRNYSEGRIVGSIAGGASMGGWIVRGIKGGGAIRTAAGGALGGGFGGLHGASGIPGAGLDEKATGFILGTAGGLASGALGAAARGGGFSTQVGASAGGATTGSAIDWGHVMSGGAGGGIGSGGAGGAGRKDDC